MLWEWQFGPDWRPTSEALAAFDSLSKEDALALADRAMTLLETTPAESSPYGGPKDRAIELLHRLACAHPGTFGALHGRMLDRSVADNAGVSNAGLLFLRASPETRDTLLNRIEAWGTRPGPSETLEALAWIGDEVVAQTFAKWRANPPPFYPSWDKPGSTKWVAWIPTAAGWTLNKPGEHRALYSQECSRLIEGGNADVVSVGGSFDDKKCPWCGLRLTTLFDVSPQSGLQLPQLSGQRLRLPTCELCVCYTTIFVEIDMDGNANWSPANDRPPSLPSSEGMKPMAQGVRTLGPATRTPFELLAFEQDMSQLGGFPNWQQHADYPACMRCNELMNFLGQVDTSVLAWGEGHIYAFIHPDCGVAATLYQQT